MLKRPAAAAPPVVAAAAAAPRSPDGAPAVVMAEDAAAPQIPDAVAGDAYDKYGCSGCRRAKTGCKTCKAWASIGKWGYRYHNYDEVIGDVQACKEAHPNWRDGQFLQ